MTNLENRKKKLKDKFFKWKEEDFSILKAFTNKKKIFDHCPYCKKETVVWVSCLECMYMTYCSRECRKKDWVKHKETCKKIKQFREDIIKNPEKLFDGKYLKKHKLRLGYVYKETVCETKPVIYITVCKHKRKQQYQVVFKKGSFSCYECLTKEQKEKYKKNEIILTCKHYNAYNRVQEVYCIKCEKILAFCYICYSNHDHDDKVIITCFHKNKTHVSCKSCNDQVLLCSKCVSSRKGIDDTYYCFWCKKKNKNSLKEDEEVEKDEEVNLEEVE